MSSVCGRRLIVVVTGANGGVGYGICERLLEQLCYASPPDLELQLGGVLNPSSIQEMAEVPPTECLTLVLACRSMSSADAARKSLLRNLDSQLVGRRKTCGYDEHAQRFRENLRIDLQYIDMAVMSSVLKTAAELRQRYPYISHIVCNAGIMSFSSIDYRLMIRQMLTAGLRRVLTLPRYLIANVGERSVDKLGWVWQCNVFAHYALVRELASVLRAAARSGGPARVIWVSSLEASAMGYDPDDWQLLRTPNTYALSKFQMDLVTTRLDVQAAAATADGAHDVTRHFIFQPGVVSTNIAAKQVSSIQALATSFSFLLARWLGSSHHTVNRHTAAMGAVHIMLAPIYLLALYQKAFASGHHEQYFAASYVKPYPQTHVLPPRESSVKTGPSREEAAEAAALSQELRAGRFGTETDRLGRPRLGMTEVRLWDAFAHESKLLIARYDTLLDQIKREHGEQPVDEQDGKAPRGANVADLDALVRG